MSWMTPALSAAVGLGMALGPPAALVPLALVPLVAAQEAPRAAPEIGPAGDPREDGIARMLKAAFPDEAARAAAPATGRELFLAVLESEAFLHEATGPFDVHVQLSDGLRKPTEAKKTLQRAVDGLAPLLPVMELRFGRASGAVSGHRFPVVLCESQRDDGQTGFEDLLALLDHCETLGFSGWKPDLQLWSGPLRAASVARTWDVLLLNLAHPDIGAQGKAWFEHGLGYEVLNQVTNRLFAKGAWGPPPPWLRQGLTDELDIEAFGTAWVASGEDSSWSSTTSGWQREGWSGFVPQGQSPPPPVTGPPPGLSRSMETRVNADTWLSRSESGNRHWSALAADRKSESPASLCAMAAAQTYGPRDRAYARCVLHLLLDLAPPGQLDLLASLDRESLLTETGMRDADPLPVVVARSLGGLPALDALEQRTLHETLTAAGRQDVIGRLQELGAAELLTVRDHRDQARWQWGQPDLDPQTRQTIWEFIVQAEAYQQLGEWEVVGQALDRAAAAALAASASYPKAADKRESVTQAFTAALAE